MCTLLYELNLHKKVHTHTQVYMKIDLLNEIVCYVITPSVRDEFIKCTTIYSELKNH